jgi:hypothetical protein
MDLLDNNNNSSSNKTGSSNGASSINGINSDNEFNIKYDIDPEIEEPNPSIATPTIPEEMPSREGK